MECATFQVGGAGMGNLYLEIVSAMFLHWFFEEIKRHSFGVQKI